MSYPKYLYRIDDGLRLTLVSEDGIYTMDNNMMYKPYTYSYKRLIDSEGFTDDISKSFPNVVKEDSSVKGEIKNALKCLAKHFESQAVVWGQQAQSSNSPFIKAIQVSMLECVVAIDQTIQDLK